MLLAVFVTFMVIAGTALAVLLLNYWRLRLAEDVHAVRVTTAQAARMLQTGDIVAFSSQRPGIVPRVIALVTHSPYLHLGIVVGANMLHYTDPAHEGFYLPRRLCPHQSVGPNLSDMRGLLERFAASGALITIMRHKRSPTHEELVEAAHSFCGIPYDAFHTESFVRYRLDPRGVPTRLQCNTFVGALLERLGVLTQSPHPVTDYKPGRILHMLALAGYDHAATLLLTPLP